MKKISLTKLLTAKQARKKAHKSFKIFDKISDISRLIRQYSELGFTNTDIDIYQNVAINIKKELEKKGYEVWIKEGHDNLRMEIYW